MENFTGIYHHIAYMYLLYLIPQIFLEMTWQGWMAWAISAALAPGALNRSTAEGPKILEPPARWKCWGRGARSSCNREATHSKCRAIQDHRRCHKAMATSTSTAVGVVRGGSIHQAMVQMVLVHLLATLQAAVDLARLSRGTLVTKVSQVSQDTLVSKATLAIWPGSNSSRCSSKCTDTQASQCPKAITNSVVLQVQGILATVGATQASILLTLNNRPFHKITPGSLATPARVRK